LVWVSLVGLRRVEPEHPKTFQNCSELSKNKHSRTFHNIHKHSKTLTIFKNIRHSRTFQNIPEHYRTLHSIPKDSKRFQNIHIDFMPYRVH
jgi:hypothetical protein